jgi:hypothetical protein
VCKGGEERRAGRKRRFRKEGEGKIVIVVFRFIELLKSVASHKVFVADHVR